MVEGFSHLKFLECQTFLLQEHEESYEQFDRLDWQVAGLNWSVLLLAHKLTHLGSKCPKFELTVDQCLTKVKFEKKGIREEKEVVPGTPVWDGDTSQFWLAAVGWVPSEEKKDGPA